VISNSGTALTENQIELIWKFFSSPVICLDGDESGQRAASRIAERLFPLIDENNKIYFSILPKNEDPDDFIKKNGKEKFISFLNEKKIIQKYIWDLFSNNLNKNDPYAISKFEKTIKKLCYSIKDEVLRKYILEDYLEKIKELTPIQNIKKSFQPYKNFGKKEDFRILKETKQLHRQKDHLSKEQLNEYSLLYIMINYPNAASTKVEELSEIILSSEANNELKNKLLECFLKQFKDKEIKSMIDEKFNKLADQIEKNSNLKNIIEGKSTQEKAEMLDEFIQSLKEVNQLKEIEFLESKVAKNLDESSYTELIKLKNQLNRE